MFIKHKPRMKVGKVLNKTSLTTRAVAEKEMRQTGHYVHRVANIRRGKWGPGSSQSKKVVGMSVTFDWLARKLKLRRGK